MLPTITTFRHYSQPSAFARHMLAAALLIMPFAAHASDAKAGSAQTRSYFTEQCQEPKDEATAKAIEKFLEKAGTRDCATAQQYFKGQPALRLNNTGISDVQLILEFNQAQLVDVSGNEITDLCPLAEHFPNLIHLLASRNQVAKISCLTKLKRLATLEIAENAIGDGTPLARMPMLEGLDISGNPMVFLEFHPEPKKLIYLAANHVGLTDLATFAPLHNLQMLRLSGNSIEDISMLTDIPGLQWLDLSHNKVADIAPLAGKPQLKAVNLSHNEITDVSPLLSSPKLANLNLKGNLIAELPPFDLPDLLVLELSNNAFTSTSSLAGLKAPKLSRFTLAANKIKRVTMGDFPAHTTAIDLTGNQLTHVMFAASLPALAEMMLAENEIESIAPLAAALSLARLSLAANKITSVAALANSSKLTYVNFDDNPLGTTIVKDELNCPTSGRSRAVIKWCLKEPDELR